MPRIRKKTSKRGTTHKRTKVRQKAAETRKKRKKDAKKNTQWTSKHKKDPGIPSTLPFKEDILTEIEVSRRQAEEDKQRRKETKQPRPETETVVESAPAAVITADDDVPPVLIDSSLPNLGSVIDSAHVVLYVLDARDPQSFRNSQLEKVVGEKGKPIVVVLTKTDLVPREVIAGWIAFLQEQFAGAQIVPFRASEALISPLTPTKGKHKATPLESISKDALLSALAKYQTAGKETRVAVVGLTNCGKSTLINSLLASSSLPTYKPSLQQPKRATYQTTTEGAQPVQVADYTFIDTPGFGVIQFNAQGKKKLSAEEVELSKAKDLLLRNRGSFVHWKETDAAAAYIVSRAKHQDLILRYNVPAFQPGDVNAFLGGVARASGRIRKHGELDLPDTARSIARDWSLGTLPFYSVPPTSSSTSKLEDPTLDACLSLKEFRAAPRAWPVQLDAGAPDERTVEVDAAYAVLGVESVKRSKDENMDVDGEEEEEEDSDEDEDEEMGSAEEDELEEDESEEEAPPPKPKSKKVSFATKPEPPAKSKPAPKPKPTPTPRRIGNASTGKSKKPTIVNVAGEEGYDFSKFF